MALSGLEIYKHLPKTNCKKCGLPTCLAFAMALAGKKTSLDKCPDITDEGKSALDAASAPPMATIEIGTGDNKVEVGGETVLFRHEKTFFHETAIAVKVSDNLQKDEIAARVKQIEELKFERVGMQVQVNLIALSCDSGDAQKYADVIKEITLSSKLPLVLMSENAQVLEEALKVCAETKPLIYAATEENHEKMQSLAKQYNCPLVVKAADLEALATLSQKITSAGLTNLVLEPSPGDIGSRLKDFTKIRRLSLKKNYRPMGFPVISIIGGKDPMEQVVEAALSITKYTDILVIDNVKPEEILPLVTLRQNIYTDPQKPIMMEPMLYEVGTPNENSPVIVTTNFSLTFFTVQPEIEGSKIPAYLLITDSDGLSVLTAWAAEKFTAEIIADAMKKAELEKKVSHKKIIIPGYVAVLSAKLKEESGWEVMVGPKEASALPKYLKESWQ